jgi:D-alanyl-D-alanine dipeptidase
MRGLMRKHLITEEEKVAKRLATIISDVRLDLDEVGIHLAQITPTTSYNRLMLIAEAAEFEKENIDVRYAHEPLF